MCKTWRQTGTCKACVIECVLSKFKFQWSPKQTSTHFPYWPCLITKFSWLFLEQQIIADWNFYLTSLYWSCMMFCQSLYITVPTNFRLGICLVTDQANPPVELYPMFLVPFLKHVWPYQWVTCVFQDFFIDFTVHHFTFGTTNCLPCQCTQTASPKQ